MESTTCQPKTKFLNLIWQKNIEKSTKEVDKEKAINSVDYLINLPELSQKSKNNGYYS